MRSVEKGRGGGGGTADTPPGISVYTRVAAGKGGGEAGHAQV